MGNLTGITFPLYMRVGLDSASLQSSRSCLHAGAWWGWGCGSKVIDSEPTSCWEFAMSLENVIISLGEMERYFPPRMAPDLKE